MIKPRCASCRSLLAQFGAILISPPIDKVGLAHITKKFHLCAACYQTVLRLTGIGK